MKTIIKLEELETIDHLDQFLNGTQAVIFESVAVKKERYWWIQHELVRFDYLSLSKANKGVVVRYLVKFSSYSRQQITRLIGQCRDTGYIKHRHVCVEKFQTKYTRDDIGLMAKMNELYDTHCGHTIKKLCERAYIVFNDTRFEQLSQISVNHFYNLRKSKTYKRIRQNFEKQNIKHPILVNVVSLTQKVSLAIFTLIRFNRGI